VLRTRVNMQQHKMPMRFIDRFSGAKGFSPPIIGATADCFGESSLDRQNYTQGNGMPPLEILL